ncbi:hypothetical protein KPH14_012750 [Odynerus spinipes]|uniref:Uncharacterized protein n=1 Tax=Odynerus spinipes TaxID=1348599 RepID=A0AAD9REZ9_9HYME|nr:hypothetical protein KPH14_012750 [Odynerus spinipes]
MYDAGPIMGSMPIEQLYGANMDHSTFPLLVERTFRDIQAIDDRLSRKMSYCAFLHHCVTGLNANIIQVHQNENKDGGLRAEGDVSAYLDQMVLPGPIADYFAVLGEASTAGGEVVAMNIPPIAIPRATGAESGTFGPITAETHNAYECYVAPRVTRRRIEAQQRGNRDWTPLDPALMPENSVATSNFLGYGEIENLQFPSDDENSIEGRLQYSPQITGLCNTVLNQLDQRYRMVAAPVKRKHVSGFVAFVEVLVPTPLDIRLTERSASERSPKLDRTLSDSLHEHQTEQLLTIGRKRYDTIARNYAFIPLLDSFSSPSTHGA